MTGLFIRVSLKVQNSNKLEKLISLSSTVVTYILLKPVYLSTFYLLIGV
jgi:hypothetical protein